MSSLLVLSSSAVVAILAAAAGVPGFAGDDNERMTICHKQGNDVKTMEIPRNAWSGHKGHGDHEGACTAAEVGRPSQPAPPRPATTLVALRHEGEGDLDGDATFRLVVANEGSNLATGLRLTGTLDGDGQGTWSLRPSPGSTTACAIRESRLTCDLSDLRAGGEAAVRLAFDGSLSLCREVGIDLALSAANDASGGDDRARGSVWVGACSPLDRPDAAGPVPAAPA